MKFINCTAHKLLPEQIEVAKTMGVTEFVELPDELKSVLLWIISMLMRQWWVRIPL